MKPQNYPSLKSPGDVPERFVVAWNERDPAKLAAIFDEDADFVNVVGLWWHNRNDIFKAHEYGLRVIFKDSTLKLQKLKVKYLSESIAVVYARVRLTNQTALKGNTAETRQTLFSFVVHKKEKGNSWSCASAHNTDIIPGKETHIITKGDIQAVDYRKEQ